MLILIPYIFGAMSMAVGAAILDPSLFLQPGPPLTPNSDDISPEERWNHEIEPTSRVERDTDLIAVPLDTTPEGTAKSDATEAMDNSETFWSGYEPGGYGLYGLPLSFKISGTYGRYAPGSHSGILSSSYAFSNLMSGKLGSANKALAGTSYGSYGLGDFGTRIYGGNTGATWSGWGNGKWGHYGKG